MYGFLVNACETGTTDRKLHNRSNDYASNYYMSRPEEFSNKSLYDYEPLPNDSTNKWLTDYGWV